MIVIWYVMRAVLTVAYLYEVYTIGLEVHQTISDSGFNISQKIYTSIKMWDAYEIGFFVVLTLFIVFIWFI